MNVTLLRGNPRTVHIAANAAVQPGDVMVVGDTPFIAINRCANGAIGAFAAGGGVYAATAQTSTGAPVAGQICNFATNIKVGTATGKRFGICLSVSGAACEVLHNPDGTAFTAG